MQDQKVVIRDVVSEDLENLYYGLCSDSAEKCKDTKIEWEGSVIEISSISRDVDSTSIHLRPENGNPVYADIIQLGGDNGTRVAKTPDEFLQELKKTFQNNGWMNSSGY